MGVRKDRWVEMLVEVDESCPPFGEGVVLIIAWCSIVDTFLQKSFHVVLTAQWNFPVEYIIIVGNSSLA